MQIYKEQNMQTLLHCTILFFLVWFVCLKNTSKVKR